MDRFQRMYACLRQMYECMAAREGFLGQKNLKNILH